MRLSILKTSRNQRNERVDFFLKTVLGRPAEREMGARGLRLVGTAGAVVFGGIFGLSMVSSIAIKCVQNVVEAKKKSTAPPCGVCRGKGFVPCKLCLEKSVIYWSPLLDPVVPRPCLCPTCDGNKVQRCLNCIGRGYS